jgi:hypothetical protein
VTFIIYGLRVRGSPEVRYVGRTRFTPADRLVGHVREAKLYGRRPTAGFGGWLLDNEGDIEAFEIATVTGKAEACAAERAAVEFCCILNHRLFNTWLVPRAVRLLREAA